MTKLINSLGAVVEQYSYNVYGQTTIQNASGTTIAASGYGNRFMFAGGELIAVMGLFSCRNRFYSPVLGRFLQPDPIGHAGDPYNIYRYCGNNPLNATDPDGLDANTWIDPMMEGGDGGGVDQITGVSAWYGNASGVDGSGSGIGAGNGATIGFGGGSIGSSLTPSGLEVSYNNYGMSNKNPLVDPISETIIGSMSVNSDGQITLSGLIDPNYRPSLSSGASLNPETDVYGVVPWEMAAANGGNVNIGDTEVVTNLMTGQSIVTTVQDVGNTYYGAYSSVEVSVAGASALGANILMTNGGPIPTTNGSVAYAIPISATFFPSGISK